MKTGEAGKSPVPVSRNIQGSSTPKRTEKNSSKKTTAGKATLAEKKIVNEEADVAKKLKNVRENLVKKVRESILSKKKIILDEIKNDQRKRDDLETELRQKAINESRLEPVVEEYTMIVRDLNSATDTNEVEKRLDQLTNVLSDDEILVVLRIIVQKTKGE